MNHPLWYEMEAALRARLGEEAWKELEKMEKEKIYDDQINPLMAQIIAICKKHEIPFFATFQYSDDGFCTSYKYGKTSHPVIAVYEAIRQCIGDNGVNIDKFMIWVMRGARERGHSSLILTRLGIPTGKERADGVCNM